MFLNRREASLYILKGNRRRGFPHGQQYARKPIADQRAPALKDVQSAVLMKLNRTDGEQESETELLNLECDPVESRRAPTPIFDNIAH